MSTNPMEKKSWPYFQFRNLGNRPELVHAITTRQANGRSLNLSFLTAKDPSEVTTNRATICSDLGIDPASLVAGRQIHGTEIAVVDLVDKGRGADGSLPPLAGTDGMVTATPGLYLLTLYADCVPLLLYDPDRGVAAVAHAGWRGTVARIGEKAVQSMMDNFGSAPKHILAGIGPAIGPCCYAVGDEVVESLRQNYLKWEQLVRRTSTGEAYFDLWQANRLCLLEAGLAENNIELAGLCTACNVEVFFSHRAEGGEEGRFGAIIGLKEESCS